jgi:hypothetical protein
MSTAGGRRAQLNSFEFPMHSIGFAGGWDSPPEPGFDSDFKICRDSPWGGQAAMPRMSSLPFERIDPELRAVMEEYDRELGGSGFVRVLAHAPEVFKRFIDFYFALVTETRGSVDMKLTELVRLKVAEKNDCNL